MTEVRSGDVLRLFFEREHKNYLVGKVGKDFLKLLHEGGAETIVHQDGLLVRDGLTGFEVVRNKEANAAFAAGAYVQVHLYSGKTIVGDVVENDDGVLAIHTTLGPTIYVDLETQGDAVKMVALADSLDDFETFDTADLPEGLPELLLVKMQPSPDAAGRRVALRLHRPRTAETDLPKWFVPVGDPDLIRRTVLSADDAFLQSLGQGKLLCAVTVKKGAVRVRGSTSAVFHDLGGFASGKVLPSDVEVFPTYLPLKDYAAVQQLVPLSRAFLPGTDLAVRIGLHVALHRLFAGWRRKTKAAPRFANLADFVRKHRPRAAAPSRYEAIRALEPYQLTTIGFENLRTKPPPAGRPASEVVAPPFVAVGCRYAFAKAYGTLLPSNLFTSEALAQILALDYGRHFFRPSDPTPLSALFRIRQGGVWERERMGQRLKRSGSKIPSYEPSMVSLLNQIGDNLPPTSEEKAARAFSLMSKYTREPEAGEDAGWLYHTTLGERVVPVSVERLVRAAHLEGKYGYAAALQTFTYVEEGLVVDKASGAILGKRHETLPIPTPPPQPTPFLSTASDLSVVNLLESLCCRLGLALETERDLVLHRTHWKAFDALASAYAVAGYVAHYGGKSSSVVAETFRQLVTTRRDLHMYAPAANVSNLTDRIKTQAENAARFDFRTPPPKCEVPETASETEWVRSGSSPVRVRLGQHPPKVAVEFALPSKPETAPLPKASEEGPVLQDGVKRKVLLRFPPAAKVLDSNEPVPRLLDFVRALTVVVPQVLSSKKRHYRNLANLLPKCAMASDAVAKLYAPLAAIETDDSGESSYVRFMRTYEKNKPHFAAIAASAHAAAKRNDAVVLKTCVVNALYLYFEADYGKELIQQDDHYVTEVVKAAIEGAGIKT